MSWTIPWYNASTLVGNQFNQAASLAQGAWSSAMEYLAALSNLGTVEIARTPIGAPPAAPGLVGMPTFPGLPVLSMRDVPDIERPEFDTITIPDLTVPDFTVLAPDVVLPDMPQLATPADPGDAPDVGDVAVPAPPSFELPAAPVFDETVIPAMPEIAVPQFEGDRLPVPEIEAPGGQVFVHTEGVFSSDVQDALRERLLEGLRAGGTGIGATAEEALWDRSRRRLDRELTRKRREAADAYAASGAMLPPGAMLADLRQMDRDHENALLDLNRDITVEQARLAQAQAQFVIEKAIADVTLSVDHFNRVNQRAFEAARAAADYAFRDVEARVSIYNASVARFTAQAQAYELRIRAMLGELDAYKTRLEGARIEGEIKAQAVELFKAQVAGVQAVISVYTARLEGARIESEVIKARLAAYESRVRAYVARFEGERAKIDAFTAQIGGEKARVEIYATQAQAYESRVRGVAVQADIAKTKADTVARVNESRVETMRADAQVYAARVDAAKAEIDAAVRRLGLDVDVFKAQTEAVKDTNDAAVRLYGADVSAWEAQGRLAIEDSRIAQDNALRSLELLARQLQSLAQVSAQMAASALNSVNASASLGYTESASKSESKAESNSTSTSTSDSEVKSYSESNATTHSYSY